MSQRALTEVRATAALMLMILALTGCQTTPVGSPGETALFTARAEGLRAINEWTVSGRIAVRHDGDGGTGAMRWRQNSDYMRFDFQGPLGARSFRLSGTPSNLLLETGDGDEQVLVDAEAELRARFGWSAPFASLRYWMLGLPAPGQPTQIIVDDEGLLRELREDGWVVSYERYHADPPMLPRKLSMQRDTLRIRVIIDRWMLSSGDAAEPGHQD